MTEPTAPAPAGQSTVKVPVVGRVQKRYLYAGGAVVLVIVGYAYFRRSRGGGGGGAVDLTADPTTGALGTGDYVNPNPGADGNGGVISDTSGEIRTDADWARAVLEDFAQSTGDTGWNPQYAQIVLGKYLAGVQLDNDEQNLVRAAWALRGRPPSGININPLTTGPAPGGPATPAPPAAQPSVVWVGVSAGQNSDAWINAITATYGAYYGQLVEWNPGMPANISKDPVPGNRKFINSATYVVHRLK